MQKHEQQYLTGLLLIMVGVFLPWFRLMNYDNLFGAVARVMAGTVPGHEFVTGWVIFFTALVLALQVFLMPEWLRKSRVLALHKYFLDFLVILFIIGGLGPMFFEYSLNPHFGLLVVVVGCVLAYLGLRKITATSTAKDS